MRAHMTWWQAMITILLGNTIVLIPMPMFLDTLYTYAWFVAFALGFVLYWIFSKGMHTPNQGSRPVLDS